MRGKAFLVAAICGSALSAGAQAQSVSVENVYVSSVTGTSIPLFDPSLGTLNSILVQGSITFSQEVIRAPWDSLAAASYAETGQGGIFVGTTEFNLAALTGTEAYADGSSFGNVNLSGTVSDNITQLSQFIGTGSTGLQVVGIVGPTVGQPAGNPYSNAYLTFTFNYSPESVPEPATWAMMLLGFAGIGLAISKGRAAYAMK